MKVVKVFIGIIILGGIIFGIVSGSFWKLGVTAINQTLDTKKIAHEAFDLINELRIESGLLKLEWDEQMARKAVEHSEYMKETGNYRHSGLGYVENINKVDWGGYSSGKDVFNPWKSSTLHRFNLLDSDIHYGAVGVADNYATFMAR